MARSLPHRVCLFHLLSAAALLLAGCGGGPRIVRVTGTVRSHGKPVANLVIRFVPAGGRASTALLDENGHYKLIYDRQHEGALRGSHRVFFAVRPRNPVEEMAMQEGRLQLPADLEALLAKYGKDASPLTFEVAADGQVIDIDLD